MTKREAEAYNYRMDQLRAAGISREDAEASRRISMTLHRWSERECGDGNGCIERDETTNKPYWHNSTSGRRTPIADRETGALRRLKAIMVKYPTLTYYVQGDPRGCALYILTAEQRGDASMEQIDSIYSRGIAVY